MTAENTDLKPSASLLSSYDPSHSQSPALVQTGEPVSVDLLKNCLRSAMNQFMFKKADTETLTEIKQYVESYLMDNLLTLKLCKKCATAYLPVLVAVNCDYAENKTTLTVSVFYSLGLNVHSTVASVVW